MKQSDRNIFCLTYTQIHSFTVNSAKGVSWPRRRHSNKTPLHSLESCEFWDKILADISGRLSLIL